MAALALLFAALLPAAAHCRDDDRIVLFDTYAPQDETALSGADYARAASMSLATLMRIDSEQAGQTYDAMHSWRMFEGDLAGVRLDVSDRLVYDRADGSGGDGGAAHQRNAVRDADLLWPDAVVPYAIDSRYGPESRAVIASGMAELQEKTCVRFVPRDEHEHADYVYITSDHGCYSDLGKTGSGKQILSLDSRGCVYKGIVEHELLHALGFLHEQSRTDRDEHVEIVWQNIDAGKEGQFKKYPGTMITDLNTEYDYDSVLHYGARDFGRDGMVTIRARQAGVSFGQREGVSDNDVLKVNRLYKCRGENGNGGDGESGGALTGVLIALAVLGAVVLCCCGCYRWLNHHWPCMD